MLLLDEQMKRNVTTFDENTETEDVKMKAEREKRATVEKRERDAYEAPKEAHKKRSELREK